MGWNSGSSCYLDRSVAPGGHPSSLGPEGNQWATQELQGRRFESFFRLHDRFGSGKPVSVTPGQGGNSR